MLWDWAFQFPISEEGRAAVTWSLEKEVLLIDLENAKQKWLKLLHSADGGGRQASLHHASAFNSVPGFELQNKTQPK